MKNFFWKRLVKIIFDKRNPRNVIKINETAQINFNFTILIHS